MVLAELCCVNVRADDIRPYEGDAAKKVKKTAGFGPAVFLSAFHPAAGLCAAQGVPLAVAADLGAQLGGQNAGVNQGGKCAEGQGRAFVQAAEVQDCAVIAGDLFKIGALAAEVVGAAAANDVRASAELDGGLGGQ